MSGLDVEDQMVKSNEQRGERNLGARIRLRQLGCEEELLGKLEIIGDNLMDIAAEQGRIIQNLKKVFNNCWMMWVSGNIRIINLLYLVEAKCKD